MWPLRQIKAWFAFPEYRNSVAALVAYLPVGDITSLIAWRNKWIKYKTDAGDGRGPDNYNGADLTIKLMFGDCESIAAVFVEVIRWWFGWDAVHVLFVFTCDNGNTYEAHDVACYTDPHGLRGWIDGIEYCGGYSAMRKHYDAIGWKLEDWWIVNDLGQVVEALP